MWSHSAKYSGVSCLHSAQVTHLVTLGLFGSKWPANLASAMTALRRSDLLNTLRMAPLSSPRSFGVMRSFISKCTPVIV